MFPKIVNNSKHTINHSINYSSTCYILPVKYNENFNKLSGKYIESIDNLPDNLPVKYNRNNQLMIPTQRDCRTCDCLK